MRWPFNRLRQTPSPPRGTIEAIYGMIVAQARDPLFYGSFAVPDTVNGRFDMIVLHLWLLLRRLRDDEAQSAFGRNLVERFCSDMDDNLRELGVGDLTVPKRMLKFGEALYGRAVAYDAALAEADETALAQAIDRNILNGRGPAAAMPLAAYVRAEAARLDRIDARALMNGDWQFTSPGEAQATLENARGTS